jgi:hypothetical protein
MPPSYKSRDPGQKQAADSSRAVLALRRTAFSRCQRGFGALRRRSLTALLVPLLLCCGSSTLAAQDTGKGLPFGARLFAHENESKEGEAPCFTLVVGLARSAGNLRWFSVPRLEPMRNHLWDADPGVSYRLVVRDEAGRDLVKLSLPSVGELAAPSMEDFAPFSPGDVIGTEICLARPWISERPPAGRYHVSVVVETRAAEWMARKRRASKKKEARDLPPERMLLQGRMETDAVSVILK